MPRLALLFSRSSSVAWLLAVLVSGATQAAKYYLSPTGNNASAGSSTSPWRTFVYAIPKLNPGDSLILKDGLYALGTTGLPNVNCTTGANSGTTLARITIQAENERQAWLQGSGTVPVVVLQKCSYWNVVGLRGSNTDKASGSHIFFGATDSRHISFRRNLLHNSNRLVNQGMMSCYRSEHCLFEENELYLYTRHGISAGKYGIVRRNYANSRDYPSAGSIPGIPASDGAGGDSAVVIYPGHDNIVENNISERNLSAFNIQAAGYNAVPSSNNKFLGNISLGGGDFGGVRLISRGAELLRMPHNTYIENQVVIGAKGNGAWFRGNKNTICRNSSIMDGASHGFAADAIGPGDGAPSVFLYDSLAYNNNKAGFILGGQSDFSIRNSVSFGNGSQYVPTTSSKYMNTRSINPQLGACKVFVPSSSPLKGAGSVNASTGRPGDIGANVLCRYEGGVLTRTQLWNWRTGEFPCGARVAGVNDKPGESCFDVHKRLNVNAGGCQLPANPSCDLPAPGTGVAVRVPKTPANLSVR